LLYGESELFSCPLFRCHVKRGRNLYYDGELDKEFDVRALLDGIESPEMRLERQLQETLLHRFSHDELEQFCFKLDLPSGVIPEGTMAKMTRELVEYMRRHGRLTQLQRVLGEERPYLS
ncbi:MAG: hypothetical protein KJ069_04660, partial [Anaerolineae bacterium]|nr:hypothetical protein [Anaerolineae bacterium]